MPKKESFFKRLLLIYQKNPAIGIALLWVVLVPALGSSLLLSYLYTSTSICFPFTSIEACTTLVLIGSLLMGFALVPTTLLAIVTGFLWSWKAFPLLVIAYSMASLIGYFIGIRLDKDSLQLLLEKYPKAAKLVDEKKTKMGSLIFFIRISPVIPFALSNLLFALLKTGWQKVVVFGLFGMLPRTVMAFSAGVIASSIAEAFENKKGGPQVLLFIALLVLSIWGIIRFFKNSSSKNQGQRLNNKEEDSGF